MAVKPCWWKQDRVKSRNREIGCYDDRVALKLDSHIDSVVADVPVKFQNDWKTLNLNLLASGLHEVLRWDVRPLSE